MGRDNSDKTDVLDVALGDWREKTLSPHEARFKPRAETYKTTGGFAIPPLATPTHQDYLESQGFPGEYPYTRGVQANMYRGRLWTMRQYAGFGTAAASNERYKYLLEQGQTGLSVAFDLPTQMGYDSDNPRAFGEVGKVGVAIDSIADMETLLDGLPLDKISTSMTINSTASTLLALYIAVADSRGASRKRLAGTVQNDILKEYIARGTYVYPPRPSMRLITDMFDFCSAEVPRWNTISISGYHIREAGSNAVQEVAFTLANGLAYVQAAVDTGLDVDQFAQRLSFFFNVHNNFLEEIAKFRAARRLWARLMKERFAPKDERSMQLRFHTQTAGSTLTAQQPEVNVVRVALQALAAVLGGTQSLHTNSKDEALALPSEASALLALRTQQVIGYESGVADWVDPLGGSYAIERMTDQIEEQAMAYIERIDALGGAVAAIEQGFQHSEIQEEAYSHQLAVENGDTVVVGVNKFVQEEVGRADLLRIDRRVQEGQIARLRAFKAARAEQPLAAALRKVREAAHASDNLMPLMIDAVKAKATLGEIADVLREVFGVYVAGQRI
ncbi:MAG: methylmalonyl-CoA mutase [Deltaproteobacteria bacterium CG2_30_63_29]|nr:MAG: methylmalonyl-CoA mutase [Deltaproteobacteria bacterium CG2_30_63_29]PIV98646.1 MAG: methylmalonyl-CoA mutase [Deltaproteobacteria bacterium CG17_big_fil_post_rev_8_21_14_2_50_63_7]PJB34270.1 MAG: methylmalonyl-CoA mutase [Deltaproteobacteria bacterium CG_4_9_14_3_um_filter_63_12]